MEKTFEDKRKILLDYIKSDKFFWWKTLSTDIPFYIFDYDPEDELKARDLANTIWEEMEKKWHKALWVNIYELVLEILTSRYWYEKYVQMEKNNSFDYLSEQVIKPKLSSDVIVQKFKEVTDWYEFVYLTHLWVAWPYLRAHFLLNNLAWALPNDRVVLLMYPWSYTNQKSQNSLKLFNRFDPDNYYRAFSLA